VHAGSAERLTIRKATDADGDRLVEIDRRTWAPHVSPAPEPPPAGTLFWSERNNPDDVFVAESNTGIVGYVKIAHPTPFPSTDHVWHVTGLAVDPSAQGGGVGRTLMEAAVEEARSRGARRLTLRVFGPNERARRLYERLGFEVEGVLRSEFRVGENEYVDDYMMALAL
jgi:ribosomal protein S18 acetylase RimI-like enzyme